MLELPISRMALTLILILWLTLLGMNVVGANSQGCEAIVNGPLTSEGLAVRLYILEINETHPAVVRCQVNCLDQQGAYNPAMALIITSQEQFIIIRPSTPSIRDEIQFKFSVISSCEAQNNFTMEFEYLIYSNSSILDHTVLQCGVVCLSFINPGHPIEIWGHSYGIIQYTMPSNTELATTSSDYTELAATSNDYTELATTSSDSNMCTTTKPGIARQAASWSSGSIAIVVVVASIIVCVSLVVGLLYMKYRSHKKIAVLEEQVLLTNVVHNTNEEETKILRQMEEELPAEQTSNPSPTHTNLNQKLPDIISSRDDK